MTRRNVNNIVLSLITGSTWVLGFRRKTRMPPTIVGGTSAMEKYLLRDYKSAQNRIIDDD